jgi:hypothetical protein
MTMYTLKSNLPLWLAANLMLLDEQAARNAAASPSIPLAKLAAISDLLSHPVLDTQEVLRKKGE